MRVPWLETERRFVYITNGVCAYKTAFILFLSFPAGWGRASSQLLVVTVLLLSSGPSSALDTWGWILTGWRMKV